MEKESSKGIKKTTQNKWKVYLSIFVVFTLISMLFHIISGPIIYPTASHRETAERYQEILSPEDYEFTLDDPDNIKELEKIENSPEMQYSDRAELLTLFVNFVLWITLIGFGYSYLRKKRIGKNPVKSLALIDASSTAVLMYPIEATAKYFGYPSNYFSIPGFDGIGYIVFITITAFGLSYIFSYFVAGLFKRRYDKKYSFSIED